MGQVALERQLPTHAPSAANPTLPFVQHGHNNTEIAQELVISPKTVRNHITVILSKLQVADRSQAIIRAREAGLQ